MSTCCRFTLLCGCLELVLVHWEHLGGVMRGDWSVVFVLGHSSESSSARSRRPGGLSAQYDDVASVTCSGGPNLLWDPSTWLPCPYNLYYDRQRCLYPGSEGLAQSGSVHHPGER